MGNSLLDLIVRASRMSLREMNSRTDGDIPFVASTLHGLLREGLVSIDTGDLPAINLKSDDAVGKLTVLLDTPDKAEAVYVQPTSAGFRNLTS